MNLLVRKIDVIGVAAPVELYAQVPADGDARFLGLIRRNDELSANMREKDAVNHEWLCAVGLGEDSERVLRYAHAQHLAAMEARSNLHIIHAIHASDPDLPIRLEHEEQIQSEESQKARQRIAELQRRVGSSFARSNRCRPRQGGTT